MGEITAGTILGPSLLGWRCPGCFNFLFIGPLLDILRLLSQVAVTVFMFAVRMEPEMNGIGDRARPAFLVSHTGILVPFFFGIISALFLYSRHAAAGTDFTPFALFMGITISITAFPVLARILEERAMTKTPLGFAAITCAAAGDASAWAILALVAAVARCLRCPRPHGTALGNRVQPQRRWRHGAGAAVHAASNPATRHIRDSNGRRNVVAIPEADCGRQGLAIEAAINRSGIPKPPCDRVIPSILHDWGRNARLFLFRPKFRQPLVL